MNFLVDKITNSIEDVSSGKSLKTEILEITHAEIKKILKRDGWKFNWRKQFKEAKGKIYKLVIKNDTVIQGLICIEIMDGYIEMHLIESAPHNIGEQKIFLGVAGNLVAFACRESFSLGFEGYVAFTAKTELIFHYEQSLGAELIFHSRMKIGPLQAKKLVNSYYNDYFDGER